MCCFHDGSVVPPRSFTGLIIPIWTLTPRVPTRIPLPIQEHTHKDIVMRTMFNRSHGIIFRLCIIAAALTLHHTTCNDGPSIFVSACTVCSMASATRIPFLKSKFDKLHSPELVAFLQNSGVRASALSWQTVGHKWRQQALHRPVVMAGVVAAVGIIGRRWMVTDSAADAEEDSDSEPGHNSKDKVKDKAGSEDDKKPLSSAMVATIGVYKNFISPLLPPACRFVPTCSQYGVQAIKEFGPTKGCVLIAWRLLRCSPVGGKGYDPPKWPPVPYTYSSY